MPEKTKSNEPGTNGKPWPTLMNIEAVAEKLDISETAVKRLIKSGKLPSLKIGGARKVAAHDLWVFFQTARKLGTKGPELGPVPAHEPPARPTAEERTLQLPHVPAESATA